MDKMIAELNIENFRRQLGGEEDPIKRATLRRLIVEEERHLAAIVQDERIQRGRCPGAASSVSGGLSPRHDKT
ncbi:hypothetical protein [Jiella pacifica]|uniref:Uncharacterized protein n=1 Tax=Jiella pacifica TaxID=2696469 RepID=A0A6N9T5J7_9HYPH|nr:hypothetical protein [Jiella pacifica]NDW05475.1 hypothetical protein [Jiella pacifica]